MNHVFQENVWVFIEWSIFKDESYNILMFIVGMQDINLFI